MVTWRNEDAHKRKWVERDRERWRRGKMPFAFADATVE